MSYHLRQPAELQLLLAPPQTEGVSSLAPVYRLALAALRMSWYLPALGSIAHPGRERRSR